MREKFNENIKNLFLKKKTTNKKMEIFPVEDIEEKDTILAIAQKLEKI